MPTTTTDVTGAAGNGAVDLNMVAEPGPVPGRGDDAPRDNPNPLNAAPPSQPAGSGLNIPVPPDVNKDDLVHLLADINQRLKRLEGGTDAAICPTGGTNNDRRMRMVERKSFQKLET